ncbi:hypothetical protein ACFWAR_13245 [Streptomyces sp. NPDC059917]|uniref:hypothetical protein n=1 Tax=Streptomyces sp. NPDC059917 TaxID=3347002 RepID=UPI003653D361
MTRTSRKQRFAVLTAATALAAAGALLPSTAFAAPTAAHTDSTTAMAPSHNDHGYCYDWYWNWDWGWYYCYGQNHHRHHHNHHHNR